MRSVDEKWESMADLIRRAVRRGAGCPSPSVVFLQKASESQLFAGVKFRACEFDSMFNDSQTSVFGALLH